MKRQASRVLFTVLATCASFHSALAGPTSRGNVTVTTNPKYKVTSIVIRGEAAKELFNTLSAVELSNDGDGAVSRGGENIVCRETSARNAMLYQCELTMDASGRFF